MEKVEILLSTYNGEKFLQDLLGSLVSQDYPELLVRVRDDGSTDKTQQILKDFQTANKGKVELDFDRNIGVKASFFKLLESSSAAADYFAFCDQDDSWLPGKITKAVSMLKQIDEDIPLLYCSDKILIDENGNILNKLKLKQRNPSFRNAVVQNIASGCTYVINKEAKKVILDSMPKFEKIRMHDWWFYLTVSALGKVLYDPESLILYRIHRQNVIGIEVDWLKNVTARLKRLFAYKGLPLITEQALEFSRLYENSLNHNQKEVLNEFINSRDNLLKRFLYFFKGRCYREPLMDNIIFRVLYLAGMV